VISCREDVRFEAQSESGVENRLGTKMAQKEMEDAFGLHMPFAGMGKDRWQSCQMNWKKGASINLAMCWTMRRRDEIFLLRLNLLLADVLLLVLGSNGSTLSGTRIRSRGLLSEPTNHRKNNATTTIY
jgi:hypothetical protein